MFQGDAPDTELLHILAERDQLKAALLGLEKHLETTQDTVKALVTERDHLKKLLKVSPFHILPDCRKLFCTGVCFVHSGSRGPEAEKHHGHVG